MAYDVTALCILRYVREPDDQTKSVEINLPHAVQMLRYMSAISVMEELRKTGILKGDKTANVCQSYIGCLILTLRFTEGFERLHEALQSDRTPDFKFLESHWRDRWWITRDQRIHPGVVMKW